MPPTTDELLDLVRRVAETQDLMARRQVALEQVFRDIKHELTAWREQAIQAAKHGEEIAVLKYQAEQQQATLDKHGVRLSLLLPASLIVFGVLAVAVLLSVLR